MNLEGRTPPAAPVRVTMTEVAREAGVSQTTVSLVLNAVERARVSVETRAKVQRAAERLGYAMPRRGGSSAARPDAAMIGVLIDQISTDPWTAIAIDGARERAWERAIPLCVAVTGGDEDAERAILAQWRRQPVIGVIYGTINTRTIVKPATLSGLSSVLLNCHVADKSCPSVVPDEVAGGYVATERLLRAGHRRIGFIGGEPWMEASGDRLEGHRRALAAFGMSFDDDLVRHGDWQPSSGYRHTRDLLRMDRRPTAIVCGNDLMAMGCFDALKESGLRIPQDMAVIGYDDRDIAQHMHPPLTTVLLPHQAMGAAAAELLLETRTQPADKAAQVKVRCPLVERESV